MEQRTSEPHPGSGTQAGRDKTASVPGSALPNNPVRPWAPLLRLLTPRRAPQPLLCVWCHECWVWTKLIRAGTYQRDLMREPCRMSGGRVAIGAGRVLSGADGLGARWPRRRPQRPADAPRAGPADTSRIWLEAAQQSPHGTAEAGQKPPGAPLRVPRVSSKPGTDRNASHPAHFHLLQTGVRYFRGCPTRPIMRSAAAGAGGPPAVR